MTDNKTTGENVIKQNNSEKSDDIIVFDNVSFSYTEDGEKKTVLDKLSLSIKRGSFVALLGRNGSGKSTVAKLINMLIEPDSGKIFVDGKDITNENMDYDEFFEIRRRVGMVFQNPDNQIVTSVVEEDIAFGPENLGIAPSEIRERVNSAMKTMELEALSRSNPANLSGGQKQRVAIAGVLAMQPECMIFDESTAMLDPSGRQEVMKIIRELNKEEKITVLLITHNMDEAALADRIIVLDKNGITIDGTPREVFSMPHRLEEAGLDLPQTTKLILELQKREMRIPDGITAENECVAEIMSAIKKNQKV